MTAIDHANTLTNPKGMTPFGPISVRWSRSRKDWAATNTIEKGWGSCVHVEGKRLADVLGRLNVRVVAVKCDDCSMYYLCEPGAKPRASFDECRERVGLDLIRRPGNALNVEIGSPAPRCRLQTPAEWGDSDPRGARWLLSGGSALVLGCCSRGGCPKGLS